MFVCVGRVSLEIPASGSLKAKRQVLRRVTDRVKAKFNVSVAEVEDNDLWQRATLALAVVGNERRHVNEMMDKILHFIDEMYVAPVVSHETETLSFNDQLFQTAGEADVSSVKLEIPKGDRSLAEAEGMGDWETRHEAARAPPAPAGTKHPPAAGSAKGKKKLTLEEARAKARRLRNPRDWEKP